MDPVSQGHESVMVEEVVEALKIRPDGVYVDGTFGRGGHTQAILSRLGPDGSVVAFDRDPDAIKAGRGHFVDESRLTLVHRPFSELVAGCHQAGHESGDGIFFDLGVSSPQLDTPLRGFSFSHDGPLDMRMDPGCGEPASAWLARAEANEIADVLFHFGDERFARRIARAIVKEREVAPIETTGQLAALVSKVIPGHEKSKHPATRTFQAIRIKVNDELDQLEEVLPQAIRWLRPGGRLVVLSFHSLEHRRVKNFIREEARGDDYPIEIPVTQSQLHPRLKSIKSRRPSQQEVSNNPRARSATLHIAQAVGATNA